jgi:hypothetical protein
MTDVALQAIGNPTEPAVHDVTAYPHGPTGLIVCSREAAAVLTARGGSYRVATAADIGAELTVLEARAQRLRSLSV